MGIHKIPQGTFFNGSPEIRIRCGKEHDQFIRDVQEKEMGNPEKGLHMDCFLRPASDKERDGHLARLKGVQRMDAFLRATGDQAKLYHHGMVGWEVFPEAHPCSKLAYNDKWWRYKHDDKNLRRFGHQKREELSCIPVELRNGEYKYSCEKYLYCNGQYDSKIETELDCKTHGLMTGRGPWTE